MAALTLAPNLTAADDFYAELLAAHDGLSEDESMALNARLILILANQIGVQEVLMQALAVAKDPAAAL